MSLNLGYSVAWLSTNFLRLDCSNDPLTGDLHIQALHDDSKHLYLDQYSHNVDRYGRLYFRKSASNTAGTVLETSTGDFLGNMKYMGSNNVNAFTGGAYMSVLQTGASGAYVPSSMEWATYSDTAPNVNAIVIDSSGNVGFGEATPITSFEITKATPGLTLHNTTGADTDGARASFIDFRGHQSGDEESTLARIEGSHDGAVDDENGILKFYTNEGGVFTERMSINSGGSVQIGSLNLDTNVITSDNDIISFSGDSLQDILDLTMTGNLTIPDDGLFAATNTANYFLMADGTNYNPVTPAAARTGLGLDAGGAGDIWVEKAGDVMTGLLQINVATTTTEALILKTTDDNTTKNLFEILDSSDNKQILLTPTGGAVFNEEGNDADFRVEGVSNVNALFVQGSDGYVGIGTDAPNEKLTVYGNVVARDTPPAYSLDLELSSSQYALITDGDQTGLDITGDITLEVWVKFETLPSSGATRYNLLSKWYDNSNRSWQWFVFTDDKMYFKFTSDGGGSVQTSGATDGVIVSAGELGTWIHLAITADVSGPTVAYYKNGSPVAASTPQTNATSIANTVAPFFICANYTSGAAGQNFFDGKVSKARVWNDVRTPTEINDNYNQDTAGTEAGLAGDWKLSNDYLDATSNDNDLTAINTPVFSEDVPFVPTNLVNKHLLSTDGETVFNEQGDVALDFRIESFVNANAFFMDSGDGFTTIGSAVNLGQFGIDGSVDVVQSVVQAHSSQTANIAEWQSSGGTALTSILPGGNIYTNINSTTALVIEQSGVKDDTFVVDTTNARVGINTATTNVDINGTTTNTKLISLVVDEANEANMIVAGVNSTAATGAIIYGSRAKNTFAAPEIVSNNDMIFSLVALGAGNGSYGFIGRIDFEVDGNPGGPTNMPGRIRFSTTSDGSGTPTSRMIISEKGNVLVNGFIASSIGHTVRGAVSQSANLQEWQSSTPTTVAHITPTGGALFSDKVKFTQTDGNEAIDSLADGYMDYLATTAHRFNNTLDITTVTNPQLRLTHTDGVDECDLWVNASGDLEIMSTSRTVSLGNGTAGDSTFRFYANTSVFTLAHDDSEGTLKLSANDATNYTQFAADGIMTMAGTARTTVDLYITASGVKAPAANPAAFIVYGLCGAWEFEEKAGGSEENISGTLKLPTQMDKTVAPVFKIGWSAPGSSPGTCVWQLEYLYMSPNEDTANTTPDDTLTVIGTGSATGDGLVITSFAALATPSATDQAMFFKITRLNNDGNDNIGASIHLRGMLFTHTRDKLGTAT